VKLDVVVQQPWAKVTGENLNLTVKLQLELLPMHTHFDHVRVARPHKCPEVCVFVAKGAQSAVLFDKVEDFPSKKLKAALILLGNA